LQPAAVDYFRRCRCPETRHSRFCYGFFLSLSFRGRDTANQTKPAAISPETIIRDITCITRRNVGPSLVYIESQKTSGITIVQPPPISTICPISELLAQFRNGFRIAIRTLQFSPIVATGQNRTLSSVCFRVQSKLSDTATFLLRPNV
jgi:hypothetical protein